MVYCICPCLCGGVFVFVKIRGPRASLAEAPVDGRMYEPAEPTGGFLVTLLPRRVHTNIHVCAICNVWYWCILFYAVTSCPRNSSTSFIEPIFKTLQRVYYTARCENVKYTTGGMPSIICQACHFMSSRGDHSIPFYINLTERIIANITKMSSAHWALMTNSSRS